LLSAISVFAQSEFVVNSDGVGAKAAAMAGAQVALASDYGAVFWNPAGLAKIRQREIGLSMAYLSLDDVSAYNGGNGLSSSISDLRLQSLNFSYPFPALQGSFVVAFGYSRPADLGYSQRDALSLYRTKGYFSRWEGAAAVAISPNINLGATLFISSGEDDAETHYDVPVVGSSQDTFNLISDIGSFLGYGINLGVTYALTEKFHFGLSSEILNNVNADRNAEEFLGQASVGTNSKKITMNNPVIVRGGLGYQTTPLSLEADLCYTDWEGSKYYLKEFSTPFYLEDLQNTLDFSLGAEFLVPLPSLSAPGVKVRAGYARYQIPYKTVSSDNGKNAFSAGLGILLDKSLLLEFAGIYSRVDEKYTQDNGTGPANISEQTNGKKAFLTLSYRF
jgi:long-subunit fatty acid transport protein